MLKLSILVIAVMLTGTSIHAQSDTIHLKHRAQINGGVMFIPQGGLSLQHLDKPLESFYPVLLVMPIIKEHWTIVPFLNMTANAPGLALKYKISKTLKLNATCYKKMHINEANVKVGFETPVWEEKVALFVQYSNNFPKTKQYIVAGAFIPFTFKLKK